MAISARLLACRLGRIRYVHRGSYGLAHIYWITLFTPLFAHEIHKVVLSRFEWLCLEMTAAPRATSLCASPVRYCKCFFSLNQHYEFFIKSYFLRCKKGRHTCRTKLHNISSGPVHLPIVTTHACPWAYLSRPSSSGA